MLLIGEMDFELSLLASCAVPLAMGVIMIWVIAKQLQETGKRVMPPDLWHYPFVFFAARSIWRGLVPMELINRVRLTKRSVNQIIWLLLPSRIQLRK